MTYSTFIRFSVILIVLNSLSFQSHALSFREQLRPVQLMEYKHWHIQKKKVTGYTKIEIKTMLKGEKTYFLELNRNLDRKGELFSEKQTWYESKSGELTLYSESDYRTGVSITNRLNDSQILTRLTDGDEQLEIALEKGDGVVPFEVLTPYLQKSLPDLMKKGTLTFSLYLPMIAIELKRKGMPASLSKFEMEARVREEKAVETPMGVKPALRIQLKPTSFLINAILPKEKTTFYFTFMKKPPHILLSFQENKTKSILTTYQP